MKKYIGILLIIISLNGFSQDKSSSFNYNRTSVMFSYMPAIPLGKTSDFISRMSPRGFEFEVNRYLGDDLSAGVLFGWSVFNQKFPDEVFEYNATTTIAGTQFRYLNSLPIMFNLKKYFILETVIPYIGLGIGTSWNERSTDIGVFTVSDSRWLFDLAPEIGIMYEFYRGPAVMFKVKYNQAFKAGDFESVSYLSFGVGISMD